MVDFQTEEGERGPTGQGRSADKETCFWTRQDPPIETRFQGRCIDPPIRYVQKEECCICMPVFCIFGVALRWTVEPQDFVIARYVNGYHIFSSMVSYLGFKS